MSENGEDRTLEVARQLSTLRRQLLDLRAHRRQSEALVTELQEKLAMLQSQLGVLREETPAVGAVAPLAAPDSQAALDASLQRWLPRSSRGRPRGRRNR